MQSQRSELRGGLRARPRYPGVGDRTRRTTFPRATHPYLSKLLHSYLVEEEEEEGFIDKQRMNVGR